MNSKPANRGSNGLAKSLREQHDLPPVTDAHRREAFAQMKWTGRGYADSMADPVYARIVEIRATLIRNREYWSARGGQPGRPGAPAQAEAGTPRTQHNFAAGSAYPRTPRIF